MRVDAFDFNLPETLIALRPVHPRDAARLLEVRARTFVDHHVFDLPALLRPGDVLVVNRTKVIPARLHGSRPSRSAEGGQVPVEATLHKRLGPDRWAAFVKPAKRLSIGDTVNFSESLVATVQEKCDGGEIVFGFDLSGKDLDRAIEQAGEMPLPPYIATKRAVDEQDFSDYQTAFAKEEGSVAAPTAGLHFTDELVAKLTAREITIEEVTLHVGAGTFLPVKSVTTEGHKMHAEWGELPQETAETLNAARTSGRRIIAVGTTSLRLLESATDDAGVIHSFADETDIFITPGYRFRAVDGLLTNFHLPRSTLFMLVSAFSGLETMKAAYAHAIESGYRFYSYGDACLLWPEGRS